MKWNSAAGKRGREVDRSNESWQKKEQKQLRKKMVYKRTNKLKGP